MCVHSMSNKVSVLLLAGLVLLAAVFGLLAPTAAYADGGSITITGNGVNNPGVTFTQDELRNPDVLPQYTELYSTINTWPTKYWYRGTGVRVRDLLDAAGGLKPEAELIKFTSSDGFSTIFTVQEFLYDSRYRYPHFMDTGIAGHIPGDPADAEAVEPIIAWKSCYGQDLDAVTEDNMTLGDANHLLFGQRAITEQTNAIFAKYVTTIEVLTAYPDKWDAPTAAPDNGTVSAGTLVQLRGPFNDLDKVHYTIDGSIPTMDSPMYNWIASRWSSREDFDEINHPIEITKDTTIKAVVIGPGKEDSDVATFNYQVQSVAVTGASILEGDRELEVGQTVQLNAEVLPENASDKGITWCTSDQSVASVNATGLVTAITAGTASITVTTNDGEFTDTITVTVEQIRSNLVIDKANPASATKNKAYVGHTFTVTGGIEPYSFAITDGALPEGMGLNGAVLEGTPAVSGTFTFTITVTDSAVPVKSVRHEFTLVVKGPEIRPEGDIILTVKGDGVATQKEFTLSQLEEMPQHQFVYSVINTWPSKKWYVGKGIKIADLLAEAGMKGNAQQIRFSSTDGYYITLTVQELLRDNRYRFPNFMTGSGDADGHIPGSSSGAVAVEAILALVSAGGTDNPSHMTDANAPQLMMGQRAVTEQTDPLFAKYVNEIEVLTAAPGKWDRPQAVPDSGTVSTGMMVELKNNNMDMDKIHYTIDGSTPTVDSPMYNLIAKRWWSSRGLDTVAEINHPIELTKDTTIKAVTIGPGSSNSDVVTFTYKVTEAVTSVIGAITPGEGGTVSLGNDVSVEIPAGALTGTSPAEVTIEQVTTPPAAPTGFKLLGSVYEFSVDGKTSYSFNKHVTVRLGFDPEAISADETPVIHCYDETGAKWVNISGEVSGNTVTVQVDHFTKFALMVALPNIVTATIKPGEGGTVNIGSEAVIEIPAGALAGTRPVEVTIEQVTTPPAAPTGFKLLGSVYEFSVDGKTSYSFNKHVTIRLGFDPKAIGAGENPAIHCYDETGDKWINIGGEVTGSTVTVRVDHFTKFGVMTVTESVPVIKLTIGKMVAGVDGKLFTLDAAPYVNTQVGRTLVPARFVSEALGAEVDWLAETNQVLIKDGNKEIILTIGTRDVLVNGVNQTNDCAPTMLPPGRVFVPLRFVSETLGAEVDYEAETKVITINR